MFTSFLTFLDKHSWFSHAFLAAVYTLLMSLILAGVGLVVPQIGVKENCFLSAVIVSTYFYGRESGQFDHYLTREMGEKAWPAWYKSLLVFFWTGSVIMQWVTPAITSTVVGILLYLVAK